MELELRRLEDLAESIVNDFAYMRAREEEMRDTNGKQRKLEAGYMSEVTITKYLSMRLLILQSVFLVGRVWPQLTYRLGKYVHVCQQCIVRGWG